MEKCFKTINHVIDMMMKQDERIYLLGEDILDPYGGAFKVYSGLSTKYRNRVITSPISEQALVGIANGMAIRGMLPILEIMFGDFMTLTFDQVFNHLVKFEGMYDSQISPRVIIRTPMGGYRGYGPTHSQSLEKFFVGIPNLAVYALSHLGPLRELLISIIEKETRPTLIIENKTLYSIDNDLLENNSYNNFRTNVHWGKDGSYCISLSIYEGVDEDFTLITYGGVVLEVLKAVEELYFEHELLGKVIILTSLNSFDYSPALDSLKKSGCLITVEEGAGFFGIGNGIVSTICENNFNLINKAPLVITAPPTFIPSSKILEKEMLPNKERISREIFNHLNS